MYIIIEHGMSDTGEKYIVSHNNNEEEMYEGDSLQLIYTEDNGICTEIVL